ncbi:uncharacterized protein C17orf78 homolog isoform X1 [Polypterus senegalus]|uniref:uncharacterized protein C17orf78 homolog isoform X1 n=1 Tax=Polypterus senegalus TaxID=55291 RepID=UPI0019631E67|nr:uncharacterized protein C17orf78 homolog isoform X1 [Polypterus senegalus]
MDPTVVLTFVVLISSHSQHESSNSICMIKNATLLSEKNFDGFSYEKSSTYESKQNKSTSVANFKCHINSKDFEVYLLYSDSTYKSGPVTPSPVLNNGNQSNCCTKFSGNKEINNTAFGIICTDIVPIISQCLISPHETTLMPHSEESLQNRKESQEDAELVERQKIALILKGFIAVTLFIVGLLLIIFDVFEVPWPCQTCKEQQKETVKQPPVSSHFLSLKFLSRIWKITKEDTPPPARTTNEEVIIIYETFF